MLWCWVGSDDDKLHALRLSDGAVAWQLAPGGCRRATGRGPEAARCDIEDVTLSERGVAYFAGAAIYAASPDGKILWTYTPEVSARQKAALFVGSWLPTAACARSAKTSCIPWGLTAKRWQSQGPGGFDSAPAIGPDGTAYVGDEARRLLAIDSAGQPRFSFISGGPVRATRRCAATAA